MVYSTLFFRKITSILSFSEVSYFKDFLLSYNLATELKIDLKFFEESRNLIDAPLSYTLFILVFEAIGFEEFYFVAVDEL